MTEDTLDTRVDYTPDEICAVVEALHEAIANRFRWTILPPDEGSGSEMWQTLDFEIARQGLDLLVQAYAKTLIKLHLWPEDALDPEFVVMFNLPSEVWDLLAEITSAKDWDHVPRHELTDDKDCPVCKFMLSR